MLNQYDSRIKTCTSPSKTNIFWHLWGLMYTNASPRAAQQRPPHVWTLYACAVRLRQPPRECATRLADRAPCRTGYGCAAPARRRCRQNRIGTGNTGRQARFDRCAHTTRILPLKSPLDCGDGRHDGVRGLRDLKRRGLAAPRSGGVSVLLRAIFAPAFSRDLKRVRRRRLDEGELATVIDFIVENAPKRWRNFIDAAACTRSWAH